MERINAMDRNDLISVALGEEPAELVVGMASWSMFSQEFTVGIAVHGNRIAAVGINYYVGDKQQS
jgi:hypothetical protein